MTDTLTRSPGRQTVRRQVHRGVAAVLWVSSAVVLVALVDGYADTFATGRFGDLQVYVGAVRQLAADGDLYGYVAPHGGPFTYPPFAAIAFLPLMYGDPQVLWLIWTQVSIACLLVIAWVVVRRSPVLSGHGPVPPAAFVLVLVLSTPVRSDLRMGQVSLILATLVVVDLLVLDERQSRWSGVLTGVAGAIKLTPLAVLPALWAGRRRAAAVSAAVTFAGATALGWLVLRDQTTEYWTRRIGEMDRFGPVLKLGNQSLNSMLMRWGAEGATLTALWFLLAGSVLLVSVLRAGRAWRAGERLTAVVVVGCGTVIASPASWTHHQIWTVLALAIPVGVAWWSRSLWIGLVVVVMTTNLGGVQTGLPPVDWTFDHARGLLALLISVAVPWRPGRGSSYPTARRSLGRTTAPM